ncbi:hypothetical protein GIB67_034890 [Kingdonia uniflora]|uniref:Uncharacterized protein n=1 Tax=Kingdonia uniflora TaxID=39325 RepID=A0A7J7KVT4_9MAGN|nr:hypothetical protein GIB67_034890 [Kingdonia uniflora]
MGIEGGGDEMIDIEEVSRLKRKERDFTLRALINWPLESSSQVHSDTHVNSIPESQQPCTSQRSVDDRGVMVEELTLEKHKSSRISISNNSSNRTGETQNRQGMLQHLYQGKWQNLYQVRSEPGDGSSPREDVSKNEESVRLSGGKDVGNMSLPQFWGKKTMLPRQSDQNCGNSSERISDKNKNTVSNDTSSPRRTSTNGFSQFFLKNKVKEQGFDYRQSEEDGGIGLQNDHLSPHIVAKADFTSPCDGISLREWLKPGYRKLNKCENLYIFTQIVKLVDTVHSQKVALPDIRPSCFKLLPSNRIKYVGLFAQRKTLECVKDEGIPYTERYISRKQYFEQCAHAYSSLCPKQIKISGSMKFVREHFHGMGTQHFADATSAQHNPNPENRSRQISGSSGLSNPGRQQMTFVNHQLEESWYTSPEELGERPSNFSQTSIVWVFFCLRCEGLFKAVICHTLFLSNNHTFWLFCCFESLELHAAAMSDLRHRILPPNFLSESPKEAGFCLWLVHPETSSRPTTREILRSELISKTRESLPTNQGFPVDEHDIESELLLHFLTSLQEKKQEQASKLIKDIGSLEADLEKVDKMHLSRTGEKFSLDVDGKRLTKNFSQLENAYFSTRSQIQLPDISITRLDTDLLKSRDHWSLLQNEKVERDINQKSTDCLEPFFDGLCKYARYSKFKEIAALKTGDLLNSANVICSMSFDRDQDYFATAGVSKKIKIFEFSSLLDESVDIHYPVLEMANKSKLSCICWNSYIKNYLASTDYDGAVQVCICIIIDF